MDRATVERLRRKLELLSSCGLSIDIDTRNSPATRQKGRTIQRLSEELLSEIKVPLRINPDAHLGATGD